MTRLLFTTALLLGATAVGWIGSVMANTNGLALAVTLVIGGVYGLGAVELFQFRHATSTLLRAMDGLKDPGRELEEWLGPLHASIRSAVRLRIEGERTGLPAPILTPYLIGLLVMLGLLGTFVGMVETLKGTVIALEGAADIQAIRQGLAAPIRGLSLAFGTSVAGVATSAMLGLMSTLSRRERILATRDLDRQAAATFPDRSLAHSQRETFRAIQLQTRTLPEAVDRMAAVADRLDRLGDRLLANQEQFHATVKTAYTELAASVDTAHRENLRESIQLVGERLQGILQDTMAGITTETRTVHDRLSASTRENAQTLSGLFAEMSDEVARSWTAGVAAHVQSNEALMAHMDASLDGLIQSRIRTEAAWLDTHGQRMDALTAALKEQLNSLREEEARRGEAAVARLSTLESALSGHLASLVKEIEDPMDRLIHTVTEVPAAAAQVIGQLRQEASKSMERDKRLLEAHGSILAQLDALSRALTSTSTHQHGAIDALVAKSTGMLEDIAGRFSGQVAAETSHLSDALERFAVSAVEMASLGDAFSAAVQVFTAANETLMENLGRIEQTLDNIAARSDEQLGYYVAQAREMIDHCLLSQKEIFEELQQLRPQPDVPHEAGEWKN